MGHPAPHPTPESATPINNILLGKSPGLILITVNEYLRVERKVRRPEKEEKIITFREVGKKKGVNHQCFGLGAEGVPSLE